MAARARGVGGRKEMNQRGAADLRAGDTQRCQRWMSSNRVSWAVGIEIVEDYMDGRFGISDDDLVHEVEELDAASAFLVRHPQLPGRHLEVSEQSERAPAFVIKSAAGQRSPVPEFEITLRPLQRLDRGLLVDADDDGSLVEQVEPTTSAALAAKSGSWLSHHDLRRRGRSSAFAKTGSLRDARRQVWRRSAARSSASSGPRPPARLSAHAKRRTVLSALADEPQAPYDRSASTGLPQLWESSQC